MEDVKHWTAAAKNQHGSGVLAAAPASSNPLGGALAAEVASDAVFLGVIPTLVIGGGMLALSGAKELFLRIRNRDKRSGNRGVNDLVALIFYDDIVEVRQRQRFRKTTGELLEWHPLEEVTYFEKNGVRVGGTPWLLSSGFFKDLKIALTNIGIEIETEEPEA